MKVNGLDFTTIDVSGQWFVRLDPQDIGLQEGWHTQMFAGRQLMLPGTLGDAGLGEPDEVEPGLTKESVRCLRQRFRYVGVAWYQRTVRLPPEWSGSRLRLELERVMFESRVWMNAVYAGAQDSLSTPHWHEGCAEVSGDTCRITIRVDNRECQRIGTYASAYTDETQTLWNGALGRLELRALGALSIAGMHIYPEPEHRRIRVQLALRNFAAVDCFLRIRTVIRDRRYEEGPYEDEREAGTEQSEAGRLAACWHDVELSAHSDQDVQIFVALPETLTMWDEFQPHVYELAAAVTEDGRTLAQQVAPFGVRTFCTNGRRFEVNGRPVMLRGTLDCCVYPLTGYPPMDRASWEQIFTMVRSYGLNHVRFHSWCPPRAAFEAADRLGVYIQAESPAWLDTWNMPVGSHQDHYSYLPEEARRIAEVYGNHPSFCLFSNGNELNGDFALLSDIISQLKSRDKRRVYTLTSNWDRPLDEADDFFISQTVDGVGVRAQYMLEALALGSTGDFREAAALREVPVVSHETGQYAVYPDIHEIDKYTGLLRPANLEAIRADLRQKGLEAHASSFVRASGRLAVQLYRDEIEAALRTPGLAGFQLLGLHDFPGQSTATVGVLDSFWNSKGLVRAEQFRQFCSESVLLLRMPKRLYAASETFIAQAEITHYGAATRKQATVSWEIGDDCGTILDRGMWSNVNVVCGGAQYIGRLESSCFKPLTRAAKLYVRLTINEGEGQEARSNEWAVWVYPPPSRRSSEQSLIDKGNIQIVEHLDDQGIERLIAGENVLLLIDSGANGKTIPGSYFPVFWSPVHFTSQTPCGAIVRERHAALREFPSADYADYPWVDLLQHSVALKFDNVPNISPIVQIVPNFFHNHKLAALIELCVGRGKLIICTIDIRTGLEHRLAASQLRYSLLSYMASDDFSPADAMQESQLRTLLEATGGRGGKTEMLYSDLARGKKATSDSEAVNHSAGRGNDGDAGTCWQAADGDAGHWWQVDLEESRDLFGVRIHFVQAANYLYVLQVSDNGRDWRTVVNQTGQTSEEQHREDTFRERARYVRIVYNGLPTGVVAGHTQIEVMGEQ